MTLGTALLIIAILYLIDHHGLWKRAGQILLGLVILAVLIASGWYSVTKYQSWRFNQDIKKAQGLGLCTPATLPADFDFNHGWVPVLTPDNELRCVDYDKVSLEVPPNRMVLSQADVVIWKAKLVPADVTFDSTPVQHDTCWNDKGVITKCDVFDLMACAQKVRARYPHQYDDLDDETLGRKTLAKYPNCELPPAGKYSPDNPYGRP
jgi:hypothetical protein